MLGDGPAEPVPSLIAVGTEVVGEDGSSIG